MVSFYDRLHARFFYPVGLSLLISIAPPADAQDPVSQIETAIAERHAKTNELIASEISDEAKRKAVDAFTSFALTSIDQLLGIAESDPSGDSGLRASVAIVRVCDAGYGPHVKATQILLRHHLDYPGMASICSDLSGLDPVYEQMLRALLARDEPEVRLRASFALAEILIQRADLKEEFDAGPDFWEDWIASGSVGDSVLTTVEESNASNDRSEALRLYMSVVRDGPELLGVGSRPCIKAEGRAAMLRGDAYLSIGATAPNVTGRSIDGSAMNLADHRGSVVAVTFWASWCGPCMSRLPEKMALYEKFKGAGLVLVGVNADETLEDARAAFSELEMNFDSIWDDPASKRSLVTAWGIRAWPTTIVLDRDGVVRSRFLSEKVIEQLLSEVDLEASENGEHAIGGAAE